MSRAEPPQFVPAVVDTVVAAPALCKKRKASRCKPRPDVETIEIEVDGVTIRVGCGVDANTISAIVQALKASRWCAYAAQLLRTRNAWSGADCERGAQAHCRVLRHREGHPRQQRRGAPPDPAAEEAAACRCLRAVAAHKTALISQKGKLAEAIRYALSRWEGLTRFIDDGRIELDNNAVERSIRPIALNRKNALFAGSDGGAEH